MAFGIVTLGNKFNKRIGRVHGMGWPKSPLPVLFYDKPLVEREAQME